MGSLKTLKELLECLSKAGGEYGLQVNKEKTKIMKVRGQKGDCKLNEYEMVEEATYLGVTIGGKNSDIFEIENKKVLKKAERKLNSIMSEASRSADKALVGKAIWKQVSIPSILFGIGGYYTVAGLRGEMGASLMRTRIMKTTLQFVREVINGKFENIREMMLDTIKMKKGNWYRVVNSYLRELKIDWEDIYGMTKEDINKMMKNNDTKLWTKTLEEKSTLKYYKEGKTSMGYPC